MYVAETVCNLKILSCHRTCWLDFDQKNQRKWQDFEFLLENSILFHHHFVEMSFLSHTTQNENGTETRQKLLEINLKNIGFGSKHKWFSIIECILVISCFLFTKWIFLAFGYRNFKKCIIHNGANVCRQRWKVDAWERGRERKICKL